MLQVLRLFTHGKAFVAKTAVEKIMRGMGKDILTQVKPKQERIRRINKTAQLATTLFRNIPAEPKAN